MRRRKLFIVSSLLFLMLCTNGQSVNGVTTFGPLQIGGASPYKPGDATYHPLKHIPSANFYVFAVAKDIPTMCASSACGVNADLVLKMGGWITGDDQPEHALAVGLSEDQVWNGKASIVVVSNKSLRIIGIYPNRTTKDLPEILRNHPELGAVPMT